VQQRQLVEPYFMHEFHSDTASIAPTNSWADEFPLHRAAVEGDAQLIRQLIAEGYSPADPDSDSWTPLHYAAWLACILFAGAVGLANLCCKKNKPKTKNQTNKQTNKQTGMAILLLYAC
jgi:hypothetical protein